MPNTLAHVGIQSLLTRGLLRDADIKWAWTGCVIPDLPWILQRALRSVLPEATAYDVRLYAIAQSTLLLCLVLAAALSLLSRRPGRVFAILALGCLLHLILDALQTKWANGVHLFAPISWELLNFGFFWPEGSPTWVLTALGLIYGVYAWLRLPAIGSDLTLAPAAPLLLALGLLGVFLALPLAFMQQVAQADNHFVQTLRNVDDRPGKPVAFDRARIVREDGADRLVAWSGEGYSITGSLPEQGGKVSVKGRFVTPDVIEITDFHLHAGAARDLASYLGLALVLAWWLRCVAMLKLRRRQES